MVSKTIRNKSLFKLVSDDSISIPFFFPYWVDIVQSYEPFIAPSVSWLSLFGKSLEIEFPCWRIYKSDDREHKTNREQFVRSLSMAKLFFLLFEEEEENPRDFFPLLYIRGQELQNNISSHSNADK